MITGVLAKHPDTYLALDYINYDEFHNCISGSVTPAIADVVAQGEFFFFYVRLLAQDNNKENDLIKHQSRSGGKKQM